MAYPPFYTPPPETSDPVHAEARGRITASLYHSCRLVEVEGYGLFVLKPHVEKTIDDFLWVASPSKDEYFPLREFLSVL